LPALVARGGEFALSSDGRYLFAADLAAIDGSFGQFGGDSSALPSPVSSAQRSALQSVFGEYARKGEADVAAEFGDGNTDDAFATATDTTAIDGDALATLASDPDGEWFTF
jgi:hypothetical protein